MTEAISAQKLTVRYGDQIALAPATFAIPKQQLTFLVGPNGSGKSTLISALLDLVQFKGSAKILGRPAKESYHSLGYVPQRFSFDRTIPLTVRELLILSLAVCHCSVGEHDGHLHQALKSVGVDDLIERPLSSLSGGQLQRVLLARALVHHPQVIILDEPEAGIDRQSEVSLYPMLRNLVDKDGLTVLIASHDLEAARQWADLVLAMSNGRVTAGPPAKILSKPSRKQLFSS